jgi:hypothetical protein
MYTEDEYAGIETNAKKMEITISMFICRIVSKNAQKNAY